MIGSFLYSLQLWTYIMPKRIIYLRHFSRLYRLLKIMKRSMFSILDCKQGFIRELTIIYVGCRMPLASDTTTAEPFPSFFFSITTYLLLCFEMDLPWTGLTFVLFIHQIWTNYSITCTWRTESKHLSMKDISTSWFCYVPNWS